MAHFSQRTGWELGANAYSHAVAAARAAGRRLIDLTVSNPTRCGFDYAWVGAGMSGVEALKYEPEPRGMESALRAVAEYYGDAGVHVGMEQIVLTASTSEAYSYLFRLLCDAGEEVLAARPSYPLFDFLAGLDDVRLVDYPLFYDYGWHIDLQEMERRITPRTRAVVVVHPNNPTGHYTGAAERAAVEEICRKHGLALIVDEVFLDYGVGVEGNADSSRTAQNDKKGKSAGVSKDIVRGSFANGADGMLTFVLSGLSKVCALPQMKVSWIVVSGPEEMRRQAMERLEVIADTFLSVNIPVQVALPGWLRGRARIQREIRARVETNLKLVTETEIEVLQVEGGWTVVVRMTAEAVERTVETGVIVQPGGFYGLGDGRAVVSLITPVEEMRRGLGILAGCNN